MYPTTSGRHCQRQAWDITVEPDSYGTVTIRLPQTTDCNASGAICTSDGRKLSAGVSATVAGPVGISIADARVDEGAGALLAFAVTLSRAASGKVRVDYATTDASAQAGVDYTAASGTLTFQTGQSSKTIEVAVLDDAHDEGEETLTLSLSNVSGGRLTDDEATGTIVNSDPLPRALLARFGRTAAVHVVEHVEERMAAPREPGFEGRFAGRQLRPGMERDMALEFLSRLGGSTGTGFGNTLSGSPVAGTAPLGAAAGSMGMAGQMGAPGTIGAETGAMGAMAGPAGGPFDGGLLSMGLGGGNLRAGPRRRGRLRARVQGGCLVGRHRRRGGGRPGGADGGDGRRREPVADGAGELARLHAAGPAVADAERGGRPAA